jgi:hypothetical protein
LVRLLVEQFTFHPLGAIGAGIDYRPTTLQPSPGVNASLPKGLFVVSWFSFRFPTFARIDPAGYSERVYP